MAIHYLANRLGGRLCAAVCAVSFLTLFAFAHISVAGNYNFVTPVRIRIHPRDAALPDLPDLPASNDAPAGELLIRRLRDFWPEWFS